VGGTSVYRTVVRRPCVELSFGDENGERREMYCNIPFVIRVFTLWLLRLISCL
jgi:hypothetical protein